MKGLRNGTGIATGLGLYPIRSRLDKDSYWCRVAGSSFVCFCVQYAVIMSMVGLLTLDLLASSISICLLYEPWRFLPHISGGEINDSRSILEVSPKQGQKHRGGVVNF